MRLPRKLKKLYKKYNVPYSATYTELKQYIDREKHLNRIYPDNYNHYGLLEVLKQAL